jgi:hypothetical protein
MNARADRTPRPPRWRGLPALGVDVGGVIVHLAGDETGASLLGDRPLEAREVPGSLESLHLLQTGAFRGQVFIVSKAGPNVQERTRAWFEHIRFHEQTGIPEHHLHFARHDADKAVVCERLGITYFVDDSIAVLSHLDPVVHRYLFTGGQRSDAAPPAPRAWAMPTDNWAELTQLLLASVASEPRREDQ